jgi:hypothetical protein
MVRRWLIRGLALTLLTLCVGAWAGSYFEYEAIDYEGATRCGFTLLEAGELQLFFGDYAPWAQQGWDVWHGRCDSKLRAEILSLYKSTQYHLLGFAWQPRRPTERGQRVMIPLWFPTLLSALLLWLVWRKTRPAYNGRGFPVEVGGRAGKEATKP